MRTDGHDEANSRFSQLCEMHLQMNIIDGKVGYYEFCSNHISYCYCYKNLYKSTLSKSIFNRFRYAV